MHPSDRNASLPARRKLLGGMVSAAALLGLNAAGAAASEPASGGEATPPELVPTAAEELLTLARLRKYKTRRSSSWDRTGGNNDSIPVEPGQTASLLDVSGAGVVTHIWFTINSPDPMHLKNLVLRAWWDGEATPSVEVPIGDFFGLGLGEYFVYQSALLAVAPIKALNAYFQMPFASSARITLFQTKARLEPRTSTSRSTMSRWLRPSRGRGALPCAVSPGRALQGLDRRLDQQRQSGHQRAQEPERR
jgi:hypothetical protein